MKKNYKRGIAMIELIFAMVIIGIVLLSAPMLIHQSAESNAVVLQQEAIAAASAHMGIVLSKHWDEADANLTSTKAPILRTTNGFNRFDFNSSSPRRGNIAPNNNFIIGRGFTQLDGANVVTLQASLNFGENADNDSSPNRFDDVDDYHNSNRGLTIYRNNDGSQNTSAAVGDYVDLNLTMRTNVAYINDTPSTFNRTSRVQNLKTLYDNNNFAGSSNIKFIHVQLTTNNNALNQTHELNKSIVLEAFSCNIGTSIPQGENTLW